MLYCKMNKKTRKKIARELKEKGTVHITFQKKGASNASDK